MQHDQVESHFFLGLLIGILVLTGFVFLPYLDTIVLSATFAIVLTPLYQRLSRAFGDRPSLGAICTVILVFLIICIPLVVFGFKLFGEAANLYAHISSPEAANSASQSITQSVQHLSDRFHLNLPTFEVNEYVRKGLGWTVQHLGEIFSGIIGALGFLLLSLLGLFYFLRDGQKFRHALEGLTPLSPEYTAAIFKKLHVTVNSVVGGTLAIAVVQGVLAGIGFALFKIPNPIFFGGATIIASLIPMIGTTLVVVPAILYLFITGHTLAAIGMLCWGLGLVGTIDNILRPYLLKRSVNIHPFLILLSVLGGLGLFGPIGFLVGPLVLSLLFALLEIYATTVLKKSNVPETA